MDVTKINQDIFKFLLELCDKVSTVSTCVVGVFYLFYVQLVYFCF